MTIQPHNIHLDSHHDHTPHTRMSQQQAILLQNERARRIQAEKRLRRWEQDHHHLFEAALEGVLLVDTLTGTITDVNPFLLELLGSTREQAVGHKVWYTGLFADHHALTEATRRVERERVVHYRSLPLHTNGGQLRSVEVAVAGVEVHGCLLLQCHLRDLTTSLQVEAVIRTGEARFVALANQVSTMLWQADTDGISIFFNTAWHTFTGLSQTESLGARWIRALHPDDREHASNCWQQALAAHQPYQCHARLRRADGIYRDVQISATPWLDAASICAGYLGTILESTDISGYG